MGNICFTLQGYYRNALPSYSRRLLQQSCVVLILQGVVLSPWCQIRHQPVGCGPGCANLSWYFTFPLGNSLGYFESILGESGTHGLPSVLEWMQENLRNCASLKRFQEHFDTPWVGVLRLRSMVGCNAYRRTFCALWPLEPPTLYQSSNLWILRPTVSRSSPTCHTGVLPSYCICEFCCRNANCVVLDNSEVYSNKV